MIALHITELKAFMSKLLTTNIFDDFLLQEATLQMGIGYVIDGRINKAFYQNEEDQLTERSTFITYGEVRSTLFDLIKGKRTPLGFQVLLQLPPKKSAVLFPEGLDAHLIKGLVMNIRFDGSKALITSGISYTSFSLDKAPELIWDEAMMNFLRRAGISFEEV
jgi:hypothetical protein